MTSMTGNSGAAVHLRGISKHYGPHTVLNDIDLVIPAGSFCTFLGPSGSGKTTTLNIIGGLLRPDRGRVYIDNIDATALSADKRGLGFVFQSYALFPHMTVAANIAYPLKLRGVPADERQRRVDDALALVHLTHIAHRYPSQLSGGQQQRVALARAFVFGPKVLLMDEPLSALDAGLRGYLQREIVRITGELRCTVLYVTHDQEEALSMSDQIVLFNAGGIEQKGTPLELYSRPATEFSASFIGNGRLLRGRINRTAGGYAVHTGQRLIIPVSADSVQEHGLVEGDDTAVVFRPETLTLFAPDGPTPDCAVIGEGVICDTIFAGGQIKVMVDLGDRQVLECRCGISDIHWRRGQRALLGVRTGHLPVVVPSGGGRGPDGFDDIAVARPGETALTLSRAATHP